VGIGVLLDDSSDYESGGDVAAVIAQLATITVLGVGLEVSSVVLALGADSCGDTAVYAALEHTVDGIETAFDAAVFEKLLDVGTHTCSPVRDGKVSDAIRPNT
jgi:hypothetical protein